MYSIYKTWRAAFTIQSRLYYNRVCYVIQNFSHLSSSVSPFWKIRTVDLSEVSINEKQQQKTINYELWLWHWISGSCFCKLMWLISRWPLSIWLCLKPHGAQTHYEWTVDFDKHSLQFTDLPGHPLIWQKNKQKSSKKFSSIHKPGINVLYAEEAKHTVYRVPKKAGKLAWQDSPWCSWLQVFSQGSWN